MEIKKGRRKILSDPFYSLLRTLHAKATCPTSPDVDQSTSLEAGS